MFLLTFLVLGLIIGYAQGGRANAFSLVKFQYGFLVLLALTIQVILLTFNLSLASDIGLAAHVASYLLIIIFLLSNRHIRWVELLTFGLTLNLLGVVSGGSYVSGSSMTIAGILDMAVPAAGLAGAPLWFLGNAFSLSQGLPFNAVFSLGDVFIGVGLLVISREMVLARSARPQGAPLRYRPKHLAKANW